MAIEAASARGDALDHLLLAGPPGLGKTSLAQIVAAELEVPFVQTAGPALERKGDIAAFLTALEPRSVFFVDEIHRLSRTLEETFYPAMEDHRLPITVGQGAGARVVTLELPPFTLVGATTRTGLLTTPLRDRFGIQARLEPYAVEELARIVRRSAAILEIGLEEHGAVAIAARSQGAPRVAEPPAQARTATTRVEVRMEGVVTAAAAQAALELLEVDERGLDRLDREIPACDLRQIRQAGRWGSRRWPSPWGRSRSSRSRTSYEPYLLMQGLIKRTPRGRLRDAAAAVRSFRPIPAPPHPPHPRCSEAGPARRGAARLGRDRLIGGFCSLGLRTLCPGITMAHPFICPRAAVHSHERRLDRSLEAFTRQRKGCTKCGFAFLFELLDDYYCPRRTQRRSFVCDGEGRVIGCGKNSFAFTGLEEEEVIGQRVEQVLGLSFANGDDPVATVLEWGVRALEVPVRVSGERDVAAGAKADMFPAYDDDGGLLLVLTPRRSKAPEAMTVKPR